MKFDHLFSVVFIFGFDPEFDPELLRGVQYIHLVHWNPIPNTLSGSLRMEVASYAECFWLDSRHSLY